MVREVQKGNKVPYRGFLLNVGEYEKYCMMKELMPEMIQTFENITKDIKKVRL